jgi:hypothetical protein
LFNQNWYQFKGLPFALSRWFFIFTFKGNMLFKLQKTVSVAEAKICGLSISIGRLLQITDSGKPIS